MRGSYRNPWELHTEHRKPSGWWVVGLVEVHGPVESASGRNVARRFGMPCWREGGRLERIGVKLLCDAKGNGCRCQRLNDAVCIEKEVKV